MAFVHGLVAALYALLGVVLARAWGVQAWGGWFALLIITSPMLSAVFCKMHIHGRLWLRLLAVPLFSHGSVGVMRRQVLAVMASAGVSLTVHLAAVPTLGLGRSCRMAVPRELEPFSEFAAPNDLRD